MLKMWDPECGKSWTSEIRFRQQTRNATTVARFVPFIWTKSILGHKLCYRNLLFHCGTISDFWLVLAFVSCLLWTI